MTMAAAVDWPADADGVRFPPEPWHLRGTAYVSLWRLRPDEVPAIRLPEGATVAAPLGQVLVGTAWAVYGAGGVLAYNEVLAAVRIRLGWRSFTTIIQIWVDHPASLAGGRELWAIPKQLAVFGPDDGGGEEGGFAARAWTADGRPIAALRFRGSTPLPGRWRLRTRTAQRPDRGAPTVVARAEALAAIEHGVARWRFAAGGALGFLAGREPLLSVRLSGLALRFGR